MTHTKGPWEYVSKLSTSENHNGFFIRAEKKSRNGKFALAVVQPVDEDGKEGEANARLMASAPELLEALIKAEKKLCEYEHYVSGGDDEINVENEILTARAAIAKATGEQP